MRCDKEIQETPGTGLKVLNRDAIKYIAMFTMLLNHIAHIFLTRGTPLYEILEDIGYFTAPVMCYFLVEGYGHTRSKVGYGVRLLVFAVISQIPFELAFRYGSLNMVFTLLCCFLILVVLERVRNPLFRVILCMMLMFATVNSDWPFLAPLYTILFHNSQGSRRKTAVNFGVAYALFVLLNIQSYMYGPGDWTAYAVMHAMLAGTGIIAAAVVLLVFYSGERAGRGRNFSKWFFYIFYPAHLLVLYAVKLYIDSVIAVVVIS